jgi:transposase
VRLAQGSCTSGRVLSGRASSVRILCDQLEHTQANLQQLEEELEQLVSTDPGAKGLKQMPELGPKTVAVLRAELGEVDRFAYTDQAVAYEGLDVQIKESGKFKGKAKLSKRGSGSTLVRCSTWPPCVVFVWRTPPLVPIIIISWSVGSRRCPP